MQKEIKTVLQKSARIAGVTCITAGAIAILTSGAALKAVAEGGKYLVQSIKGIVNEPEHEQIREDILDVSEEDFAAAEEATDTKAI